MKIIVRWTDRNSSEDGTRIYRSESPMNPASLPAPLATVGPGITSYEDTNVVRGKTYYYRFESFKGTDTALSNELTVSAQPRTGPGPQQLIAGDYEAGYFGTVDSSELFTAEEMAYRAGISGGAVIGSATPWLKFAYKGKILFTPIKPIRSGVTWNTIYAAGCALGIDAVGDVLPTGTVGVNQKKIVIKNGESFLVRLPKGAPSNPASWGTTGTFDTMGLEGSEWNDLLYRIFLTIPFSQVGANWSNYGYNDTWYSSFPTLCQEVVSGQPTKVLTRGGGYGTSNFYPGYADSFPASAQSETKAAGPYSSSSGTQQYLWRPILEFVPEQEV